jgi:multicomponent Na+:H+ antiporter subunit G
LVAIAVALQLACVAGVLVAPGAFAKLHFTAPASTLAPGAVAAALIVAGTPSGVAIKAVLIAVVLGVTNPVLAHATARAARARENPGAS